MSNAPVRLVKHILLFSSQEEWRNLSSEFRSLRSCYLPVPPCGVLVIPSSDLLLILNLEAPSVPKQALKAPHYGFTP